MDEKIVYLAKTLSRTKRKDYENYVINAIWNRVNCPELVPVSQQLVRREDGSRYFIDLYFPQLNIGVECDEQGHVGKEEEDAQREISIFHVLSQIHDSDYEVCHVKVNEASTFEDVEKQINEHVRKISSRMEGVDLSNGWEALTQQPSDIYKDREEISIYDNVAFHTICEVCNTIFGLDYKGYQRGSTVLSDGTFVWFPKLAINGRAVAAGWNNTISEDGRTIAEFNEDAERNSERQEKKAEIGQRRVVFTQAQDPVTRKKGYRFVGVFVAKHYDEDGALVYERVCDTFKIVRP